MNKDVAAAAQGVGNATRKTENFLALFQSRPDRNGTAALLFPRFQDTETVPEGGNEPIAIGKVPSAGQFIRRKLTQNSVSVLAELRKKHIVFLGIADIDAAAEDGIALAAGCQGSFSRAAVDSCCESAHNGYAFCGELRSDKVRHAKAVGTRTSAPDN